MFKKLIISKTLRRHVSWIIAAVLIIPFILFFHATGQAPSKGEGGAAGVIFGTAIPWETFQEQRAWLRRQLQGQFGGELPEALNSLVTQYTWDRLILLEEARHRKLRVSDQDLIEAIERISAFQDHGRFLPERYHRLLQAMGTTPQAFEQQLRNDLRIEQFVSSMKASVSITDAEVQAAYVEAHEQLQGSLLLIDPATFTRAIRAALTEADLHTEYETHAEAYRIPEQLVLEYAGATRDERRAHVQPTDEAIHGYYDDHHNQFTKADGALTPFAEAQAAARTQLIDEQVRKQLKALALDLEEDREDKRTLEEIVNARTLTLHTVGPFPVGTTALPHGPEPAVLQAAEKLSEGRLSDVIETDAGTYLCRVTQRLPSRIPAFEEVRTQLTERLVQMRARAQAQTAAEQLHAHVAERLAKGMRFEEAALTEGSLPAHPVRFTRSQSIDLIGSAPAVNEAAFRIPLGKLSDVIETPVGFVMIRPEERVPPDRSTFAAAAADIRKDVLTRKQSARLEEALQELRTRAKLQSFVDAPLAERGPDEPRP